MTDLRDLPHARRELERLEAELVKKEELARRETENSANVNRAATEDQGIIHARSLIISLSPLYKQRAEMAKKLAPMLADLWKLEKSIREVELEALRILNHTRQFMDSHIPLERLNELRENAGLPDRVDPQIPKPNNEAEVLAQTVLYGIYSRCLTPGMIAVAGRSVKIQFNK